MKRMLFWGLVACLIAMAAIRLAPSDPNRWHVAPVGDTDRDMPGGVFRVIESDPDRFARLHEIVTDTPRTYVLAGSVREGMVTYITRSKAFGFPDYTTIQQDGDILRINGRLRFGRRDFGVNRNRVDGWLTRLQF
ncbi:MULTISPECIES: DUF1499 domain-containing protein [Ruegeria]|uniref:DUF1499 domain-containing protein n=1 Tax=Ruegeria TaxID=97050 RepID=UPI00147F1FCD|nr:MULTISPECIES: DUF1499 domain-containing protein [Ruegeria]